MKGRKLPLALLISLVIVGSAVLLVFLLTRQPAADPGDLAAAPGRGEAPGRAESGGVRSDLRGPEPAGKEEREDVAAPQLDPGPPLLRGRVSGEGAGIAGASVQLYSAKRVEDAIERLAASVGEDEVLPDIPAIISLVRGELEGIRRSAVTARSGADGVYEFRRVEPGGYLVLTVSEGWLFRFGDVVSLSPSRTETLDLALDRGTSISGKAVSAAGTGVAGVMVLAEYRPGGISGLGIIFRRLLRYVNGEFLRGPFETVTGADGSFVLSSLPAGIYDLSGRKPGSIEARLQGVESGAEGAVIYMGEGATIRGSFTDGAGAAAPGVAFRLEREDDLVQLPLPMAGFTDAANALERLIGDRSAAGKTGGRAGEKGDFRMGPLEPGKYRLSVEDRGYLPFLKEIVLDWDQDLSLGVVRLDRGEAIAGVVSGEDGRPVPGARVFASPSRTNFFSMGRPMNDFFSGRSSGTTDASGAFHLAGLGRGKYRVTASAPGKAPAMARDVPSGSEGLTLVLGPGLRVTGVVKEAGGGMPLSGAGVQAASARGTSGEDGRFVLDGVVPQDPSANPLFDMEAMGMSGPPKNQARKVHVEVKATLPGYLRGQETVDLSQGEAEVEIELRKAPQVECLVLDPDGNPAAGSLVRLSPEMDMSGAPPGFDFIDQGLIFVAAGVTDDQGRHRFTSFRNLKGSGRYQLLADHVVHARGTSDAFNLHREEEGPIEVEVKLMRASRVKGMVTDGRFPVSGATVRLARAQKREGQGQDPAALMMIGMLGLPRGGEVAHTSREGNFSYSRVLPGEYVLSAEVAGFTESPPVPVQIGAGEEREVTLVVDRGGEITGVVADPSGSPLAGARLRLLPERADEGKEIIEVQKLFGGAYRSARSGEEGAFQLSGLPAGLYTVIAELPGFTAAILAGVSPSGKPLKVVLQPAAALRGQVVDGGSGRPITTFRVRVKQKRVPGEDGGGLDSFPGQEVEKSDLQGRFTRDDLEGGTYQVKVAASGYAPVRTEVVLSPGRVVDERFLLAPAGRIRGLVLDLHTRSPVAGARIALTRQKASKKVEEESAGKSRRKKEREAAAEEKGAAVAEGAAAAAKDAQAMGEHFQEEWQSGESAHSQEDGSFLLEDVPGGVQSVKVTHPDYALEVKDGVEVPSAGEVEAVFSLRPGLSVSGTVRGPGGQPGAGKMVFLRGSSYDEEQVRKSALTGSQGEFRIGGLEKGRYRLMVPESLQVSPDQVDARQKVEPLEFHLEKDETGMEIVLPTLDDD